MTPHQSIAEAKIARDEGRVGSALDLFVKAVSTERSGYKELHDAGLFALGVMKNLRGLESLYEDHRRQFNLSPDECPAAVPGTKFGDEGWRFAFDCLTRADSDPGVPLDWIEDLADALAERGQIREALQWRHRVSRHQTFRPANHTAIAVLLERLGELEQAAQEYRGVLAELPDDPAALLGLAFVEERLGLVVETREFDFLISRLSGGAESLPAASLVGRTVHLTWAAVRRGTPRLASAVRAKLRDAAAALARSFPNHSGALINEGLAAVLDGERALARSKFLRARLLRQAFPEHSSTRSADDDALLNAARWADAFVLDPASDPNAPIVRPSDPVRLALAEAHQMWLEGELFAAMSAYAVAMRHRHVTSLPMRYEIIGGHKVLEHGGVFYAVPRDVAEFSIINGKVYRLKGKAHHLQRRVPPFIVATAFRLAGWLHSAGRKVRRTIVRVAAPRVRSARRLLIRSAYQVASWTWPLYAVRDYVTAPTRAELLDAIAAKQKPGSSQR